MKFNISLILIFLASILTGQTVSVDTITIDPYLSFQNYEHFKRLTLSSPNSNIEYLDSFDFQWGYQYVVEVQRKELIPALSDGTEFDYSLLQVFSKRKVSDSMHFTLFLDAQRYYYQLPPEEEYMSLTLKHLNDSTFLYFDKVQIEVPKELLPKFKLILTGELKRNARFLFIDEKRIRLVDL
jgi:hypothetical protein